MQDSALNTKAVAIKQEGDGNTPKITAKGHGYNAEKILEIAFAEGVKVRQDKDLTELLDAFDVECPVPLEALHAVSLILERVYAENQRLSGTFESTTPTDKTTLKEAASVSNQPSEPPTGKN
ncbi:MAG: EscU/YscU/HrcU family type III secretion system export apparatus switch protein [Alphaproteobacteria bacterium]|nr:EscU/YscU/HrcU family type III secretion system export apparatus switch protein [Alphaproteobacteria bacterium]